MCGDTFHTLNHVLGKFLKHKVRRLLGLENGGKGITGKVPEQGGGEGCEMEDGAAWMSGVKDGSVLKQNPLKPCKEAEKIVEGEIVCTAVHLHSGLEVCAGIFDPWEYHAKEFGGGL